MKFVIENPPFGCPWGEKDAPEGDEEAVKTEVLKGDKSRFTADAPGSGNIQILFTQFALIKWMIIMVVLLL